MIQPCKQHTEARRIFQKGLSPQAVSTYKDLIDTTNKELLKWALDYSGDPDNITSKYVCTPHTPSGALKYALLVSNIRPLNQ
jgi:hypothetical protein